MNITPNLHITRRLTLLCAIWLASCLCACSWHRQPKSSARIINEGDRNPFITMKPERAGEVVRDSSQR
jgi:hypothetical protein